MDIEQAIDLTPAEISSLPEKDRLALADKVQSYRDDLRKRFQILFYEPVSDRARQIHMSTVQQSIATGGNRCLPLNEPVLMANGLWKLLRDIKIGDWVLAVEPATGIGEPARVSNIHRAGLKKVWEVGFSDGGSFRVSEDHSVPLYLGSGRQTSKGHNKLPHKRRIGDYLRERKAPKRTSAVSPVSVKFKGGSPPDIPPYLLGALLGDGSFTNNSVRFSTGSIPIRLKIEEILSHMAMCLRQDSKYDYRIVPKRKFSSNILKRQLGFLGLWGKNSRGKFTPSAVWFWDEKNRLEFIAGLIDTDGSRDSFTSVSRDLAKGFADHIRCVGGKAVLLDRYNAFGPFWQVYWRMNRQLPLCHVYKQSPISKRSPQFNRRIIRSATSLGDMECGDITVEHPSHCYVTSDYVIISNSAKTDTSLAELSIQMTGIVPYSLEKDYPAIKLRPPIRARIVCQSLTTVLDPIIKPKLQWWKWNGREPEGGANGHWGWIPPHMLIDGDWGKSWSEKHRTLTLTNGSTCQMMSYDQDVQDFSGGSFHLIHFDEGPKHGIYRENVLRIMDVSGRITMAMTPPDDEGAAWDSAWIYDSLYERGLPGPQKDPNIDSFTLFTEDNRIIDPADIARIAEGLSKTEQEVRFHGRFLHLSGRIYPIYSDRPQLWCFNCNDIILVRNGDRCATCESLDVTEFCHYIPPFEQAFTWPTVMLLDPHPRKPHCIAWMAISPSDDMFQIAELEIDDEPAEVKKAIWQKERDHRIHVYKRLIDPNMALSPANSAKSRQGRVVRDEFDAVGLHCDLADDNRETARTRLRHLLKPDKKTGQPRFHVFTLCPKTNTQYLRYSWDEWTRYSNDKKDPKPMPRNKEDDFPTLGGYAANADLSFKRLKMGNQIVRRKDIIRGHTAIQYGPR